MLCLIQTCAKQDKSNEQEPSVPMAQEDTLSSKTDFFLEEGAILGLRFGVYHNEIDKTECRNFLRHTFFPAWKNLFPGSEVFYLDALKGPHTDKEVFFWAFQDRATHASYFPHNSFPSEAFEKRWETIKWLYADTTLYKYLQSGWSRSPFAKDYELIASGKATEMELLKPNTHFIIESFQLNANVTSEAFEQYLHKQWKSEAQLNDHGANFMLKRLGSKNQNQYAQLFAFEAEHCAREFLAMHQQKSASNDAKPMFVVANTGLNKFAKRDDMEITQFSVIY